MGTITTVDFVFKIRHRCFWRPVEGTDEKIDDRDLLTVTADTATKTDSILDPQTVAIDMHFLRDYCCSFEVFKYVKDQAYDRLYHVVSNANREGCNGMGVVLYIELQIIDMINEEDIIALAMRESAGGIGPASRSSIEDLPMEFISSRRTLSEFSSCTICFEEFAVGMMLIRLPCSHGFHGSCIERWQSETNSCLLCRAPI